jgi:hypothetical protein
MLLTPNLRTPRPVPSRSKETASRKSYGTRSPKPSRLPTKRLPQTRSRSSKTANAQKLQSAESTQSGNPSSSARQELVQVRAQETWTERTFSTGSLMLPCEFRSCAKSAHYSLLTFALPATAKPLMRLSSKFSPSHPSCQVKRLRLQHSPGLQHSLRLPYSLRLRHNLKSRHNPDKKLFLPLLSPPLHRNHSSSNSLSSLKFSRHRPNTSLNSSSNTTLTQHRAAPAILSTLAMQAVPHPSNQCNNTPHL